MANTKVTSRVIADNAVGITQLNVSDGSDGQVLTTNGSGSLSFSTVSGTTINTNADNRVITGSGTANTLNGESNLTFDGNKLGISVTPTADITLPSRAYNDSGAGSASGIRFTDGGDGTADAMLQSIRVGNDGAHMFIGSNCYIATGGSATAFDTTENCTYVDCNAYTGAIIFGTSAAGSNPTERLRITSTGVIQSGTSTSDKGTNILNWAGSGYIGLTGDLTGYATGTYSTLKANGPYIYFDISSTYSAYMSDNGSLYAQSDRRLKENIQTLPAGQLDKVCNLRGVNFDWIDGRGGDITQVGVIAQEIQEEYPQLVGDGGIEDGTLTVDYAALVSPLIEAIKELKSELDAAKARIETLEDN